tara:strand:- start:5492 stop:6214 length:723 start_codon:yes stop_codon:yes gene_type:complete
MKIEHTTVFGFEAALRGMRNPMNSWDKSDTVFAAEALRTYKEWPWPGMAVAELPLMGPSDLSLACKLIRAGTDHRKFLRQIMIWVDLTLPRYAWQELDTYKVATVRNSCSTMHKLGHTDLDYDDFEGGACPGGTLQELNEMAHNYREKQEVGGWLHGKMALFSGYDIVRYMKGILPESFLQKATYTMSYETALSAYFARRKHRLDIWREGRAGGYEGPSITRWIHSLPYMEDFILAAEKD